MLRLDDGAARARYAAGLRRRRIRYAAVIVVVLAAAGVVVGLVWSGSELRHTTLRTVSRPPATLVTAPTAASLRPAWHTADLAAAGAAQWRGTVVTFAGDRVGGRDARTGTATWSYVRTDRTVCSVAQSGGTTVAIFRDDSHCDQVTALNSATGVRLWTRTLDNSGLLVAGTPHVQITDTLVMVTARNVIDAINLSSGEDAWTYSRTGCRITGAVLGSDGALISQNCGAPDCGSLHFCGRGPQLLLRDGLYGFDNTSTTNPDRIVWNRLQDSDRPVAADTDRSSGGAGLDLAFDPGTRQLDLLDPAHGSSRGTVALRPAPPATAADQFGLPPATPGATAAAVAPGEIVWLGGVTYSVAGGPATQRWSTATAGPVTVIGPDPGVAPTVGAARILAVATPAVPGGSPTVLRLEAGSGAVSQRYPLPGASPATDGDVVSPLGTGLLVTGPDGVRAYR